MMFSKLPAGLPGLGQRLGLASLMLGISLAAPAHPVVKSEGDPVITREVLATRDAIASAVQAKDALRLKALYTEDFTHTHGSGKVDGRDARIVSLLSAEPTIEMAHPDELNVQSYNGNTAIVRGKSPILNLRENLLYQFRWVQTYVKLSGSWKLAVSQATRLPDAPTPNSDKK
jgi:ketosteroid isomerase-like protein